MEEILKILCEHFEKICYKGDENEIKTFIRTFNFDINYDDGYFLELLSMHDNVDLMKSLLNEESIKLNNYGVARMCACHGYKKVLKYIIDTYEIPMNILKNL